MFAVPVTGCNGHTLYRCRNSSGPWQHRTDGRRLSVASVQFYSEAFMAGHLLQINFKLSIPVEQYEHAIEQASHMISGVAGLRWKIWITNAETQEAGGIYCFGSREAADAYLGGPIVANLKSAPFAYDVNVKHLDYLENATALTRGPVGGVLQAA
jgi:hypothetical protein